MDKLTVGFIGGCINKQPGIKKDSNYVSILKNLFYENLTDIDIHLGNYLFYDQLTDKTISFISKKHLDVVCIFIRPFPLMPLHKLLVKYDKVNGGQGWEVHPNLFNRNMRWLSKMTEGRSERPFVYTPYAKLSLRDLNIITGIILGLHKWAARYLENVFLDIKAACDKTNTKFILISPPKSQGSVMGNIVCKWTTAHFNKFCLNNDIGYLNINTFPGSVFEPDHIHFNEYGHNCLAILLHDGIHSYSPQ